jgi:methylmalonyl-CoA mutase N-terminal domain/subunit
MDEALALPSEKAVKLALRTQQLIAHESGVANTIDPLAGSYCIEWLTSEIEERVSGYLDKIEAMGGAVKAIEKGYMQQEIAESAYRFQKEVEENKRLVVGVNVHRSEERAIERMKIDPGIEGLQTESLGGLRKSRDNVKVQESLRRLEKSAERENTMGPILECVRNYATLGEISDALRGIFKEYKASDFR